MGNRHNKQHINVVVTSTSGSTKSFLPILCSKTSINDVAAVPSIRFDHHRLHNDDQDDDDGSQHSSSSIITDELEPVSPKVGCMGQVNKNKRSNRVAARRPPALPNNITNKNNPTTTTTTTRRSSSANNNNNNNNAVVVAVNYSKLGRLFSGKKLLLGPTAASPALARPPIAAASIAMTTTRTRIRSKSWVGPRSAKNPCHQTKGRINSSQQQQLNFIREMDPPLPVILTKKKQPQEEEDQDGEQGHAAEGGRSSLLWKRRFGDVSALKTLEINRLNTLHCRRPPPPQPLTV